MIKIRKQLCPESKYYLKCPYTRTPSRIVVHNTANDAPAINEITYMVNNDFEVSYHFAVDEKEAVQGLPLDRNAWASGDGHGKGNMEGIHIEICWSKSGGERFTKAEQNAAELIASLLKQYGWGIEKVTKHQDYDGKYCPHRTLDLGWQRFLNMVKKEMEENDLNREETLKLINETIDKRNPTYHTLDQVPKYWREDGYGYHCRKQQNRSRPDHAGRKGCGTDLSGHEKGIRRSEAPVYRYGSRGLLRY